MGNGGGPQQFTIQFTLDVLRENLTEANEEEIKEQLIAILEASGAKGPFDFEEFESGSTIVPVTSINKISYDTVVANITAINAIQTLELTDADGVKQTTIIGYVDDEPLVYKNDLIMVVNKDEIYYYTATDGTTEITQDIVNTKLNGDDKSTIQSVIFGGNTIKVGTDAFRDFTSLTTIYFGEVKTIGNSAFRNYTSLANIDFKVVNSIGNSAFADCEALTNIDFKEVKTIEDNAFRNCTSLANIDFKVVNSIGNSAFLGCTSLANIDFNVVNSIGHGTFMDTSLTELDLKEVETIGFNAFDTCTFLATIKLNFLKEWVIPESAFSATKVVTTGEGTFLVATGIPSISFETDNGDFSGLSTVAGTLKFVDYVDDGKYKQVIKT
jgi:hypothetical protein